MNIRYFTALLFFIIVSDVQAQEIDTTLVQELFNLRHQIDSLNRQLITVDSELRKLRNEVTEGMEFEKLITILDEEEDIIPEDQRSRRKRLDNLLNAITERPGQLRFNGSASAILQGQKSTINEFSVGSGSFDIYAHTAFGPNSILFIDLQAKGGSSPDDYVAPISSLNANAGSTGDREGFDRISIEEAWAEFNAIRKIFHVTAGKIDLSNYFDINPYANDETSQFISESFVNSSALPFPESAPGIRIRTESAKYFFLQVGLSAVGNLEKNIFADIFKIGSIGLKAFANTEFEGNLRIYGYQHPAVKSASGYGVSFDKSLIRSLSVFARWNKNESKLAQWSSIVSAWSLGSRFAKEILKRQFLIGIAYGETKPFEENLRKEKISELYARMQMNKWIYVSPHIQYIRNAGGIASRNLIFGLRTQFEY